MTKTELLAHIQERWTYHSNYWRDKYADGRTDMSFVAGNPWPMDEQQLRGEHGNTRPMLTFDEVSQYVDQIINNVRQNKRAIKVTPEGSGADDKTAELEANLIRQIEYRSGAQKAYVTAFENEVQRSFGFVKITKQWIPGTMDQDLLVMPVPNPENITVDPDYKRPDGSDMMDAFEFDEYTEKRFHKEFPNAKVTSFDLSTFDGVAPGWMSQSSLGPTIRVASYWLAEDISHRLMRIKVNGVTEDVYFDNKTMALNGNELLVKIDGSELMTPYGELLSERNEKERKICQYVTNGLEIISEIPWPGKYIPIVPFFGKQVYVDDGGGSKLKILSLVRLARDPIMLLNYTRTSQMELAGQVPKVPYIGYEGQFEGHEDEWANAHKRPIAFLQAKPTVDAVGPGTVLPLPSRAQWEPAVHSLEMLAESARRAIQAAMGSSPLPTTAQRQNQKSGVALEAIENSRAQGSYHFLDNYDEGVANCGRILADQLQYVYGSTRDVTTRKPDETTEMVQLFKPKLNPDGTHVMNEYGQPEYDNKVGTSDNSITIGTGPSVESQRTKVNEFAAGIATNPQILGMAIGGNKVAAKLVSLNIKLADLGPLGDTMAEVISPDTPGGEVPPEVQQTLEVLQQHLKAVNAHAQQLEGQVKELEFEKQAKVVESQSRERQILMERETKIEVAKVEGDTRVEVAKVDGAVKMEVELAKLNYQQQFSEADRLSQDLAAQVEHVRGLQADLVKTQQEHENARELQQQEADAAMQQQQVQQSHEQEMQENEPAPSVQ